MKRNDKNNIIKQQAKKKYIKKHEIENSAAVKMKDNELIKNRRFKQRYKNKYTM